MAKVVIDAGHGGIDSGAVGNGIIEKDLTLKISNYIYNRLKDLGLDVKITRSVDETLTPTERVKRVLDAFGNSSEVLVISNHINAGGGDGAEVIYALRNNDTLSNIILDEISKEGQNIRKAYQRRLPSDSTKDYYFMQRNTGNTESITIEYGFLDSKGDDVSQLKNNWQNYAEAVVRAIVEYLNLNYVPIAENKSYIVKKGDTLWSIAKKYGVSVDNLKKTNGLTTSSLSIGQVLKIPSEIPKNNNKNLYVVKSGDTLYKIAMDNNTTVSELINLNNLTTTTLTINQVLKIPDLNTTNTYKVVTGDTLYKIAENYNTTVGKLKELNNLTSNVLSVGQILNVPLASNNFSDVYQVLPGDTLYKIAQDNNTTVSKLKELNNLTSNLLSIGQKIKLN